MDGKSRRALATHTSRESLAIEALCSGLPLVIHPLEIKTFDESGPQSSIASMYRGIRTTGRQA